MPRTSPKEPKGAEAWERSVPTLNERQYSQSVERGLAILSCFTPRRPALGIVDVAEQLGMSRSTTHRYMTTLVELGYLAQGAKRKYRLALKVTGLGMSALSSTSLREHAQPYVQDLHRHTGYTVAVAVLDGPEILYVERLRGRRRGQELIDLDLEPGSHAPVHCTAMGKQLLARLPERSQRELIGELSMEARGPYTIATRSELRESLEQIREEGLAVAEEELAAGLYAIAAPLRASFGETVAAVGMSAHSSMIPLGDLVSDLGPHLIAAADRISGRMGYRRDDEMHSRWW